MKLIILLVAILVLIGCSASNKLMNQTNKFKSDSTTTVESEGIKYQITKDQDGINQTVVTETIIDSCEYDLVFYGKITCTHKDNCKFCKDKNQNWREKELNNP